MDGTLTLGTHRPACGVLHRDDFSSVDDFNRQASTANPPQLIAKTLFGTAQQHTNVVLGSGEERTFNLSRRASIAAHGIYGDGDSFSHRLEEILAQWTTGSR